MPKLKTVFSIPRSLVDQMLMRRAGFPNEGSIVSTDGDIWTVEYATMVPQGVSQSSVVEFTKKEVDDALLEQYDRLLKGRCSGQSVHVEHLPNDKDGGSVQITYHGKVTLLPVPPTPRQIAFHGKEDVCFDLGLSTPQEEIAAS